MFLEQGNAIAGGVTYGPFRAGLSYASFLSNPSLGGVPEGFDLRVNYLLGINAAYFIGQDSDRGLYVQAVLHVKEQGVTNQATAHVDLGSLALGASLGYVWKLYERLYDNDRHREWDTTLSPPLSLGYSW